MSIPILGKDRTIWFPIEILEQRTVIDASLCVRARVCVYLCCLRIVSVTPPMVLVLTTTTTLTTPDNATRTVVEREWTSSGYRDGGASGRSAEPSRSEPLLPTGEQSQRKGTSGQQLESPRERWKVAFERGG